MGPAMHSQNRIATICRFGILNVILLGPTPVASSANPDTPTAATTAATTAHPLLPAFERFHASQDKPRLEAGGLLISELNCRSCHAGSSSATGVQTKPAPVLDAVGERVRPEWMLEFLANPQHSKPGTTMPDLFPGLDPEAEAAQVAALVSFLATTGTTRASAPQPQEVARGQQLFHQVGCIACHQPRQDMKATKFATSVPLGAIEKKYTLDSLAAFLKNPLAVRPGGRMPSLNLNDKESRDIAGYFFHGTQLPPNLNFAYYEGNWSTIPDFSKIKPRTTGQIAGFQLGVATRRDQFGLRFTGFLQIPRKGRYTFFLGSDDGSRLQIDGKTVIEFNGIQAYKEKNSALELDAGPHALLVDYFEQNGQEALKVDFQGPGISRRTVATHTTPQAKPKPIPAANGEKPFVTDPANVAAWEAELTPKTIASLGSLGLTAHFTFNEKDGKATVNAVDPNSSGLIHGPVSREEGLAGQALKFDGSTWVDAGQIGVFNNDDQFSIAVQFRPTAHSAGAVFSKMDERNSFRGYDLNYINGKLECHFGNHWPGKAFKVVTKQSVSLNQWHHVVICYDGTRQASGVQMFVDGKLQELDVPLNNRLDGPITTDKPFHIGKRNSSIPFHGLIDDVQLYSVRLSAAEVERLAKGQTLERLGDILAIRPADRSEHQKEQLKQFYLVETGRKLFASIGCASCHQMKHKGQAIKPTGTPAGPLVKLKVAGGCLAPGLSKAPVAGIPDFRLSNKQRQALGKAITASGKDTPADVQTVARVVGTTEAFNCLACHSRDKRGGVERPRNALFLTTIKEMGDEGRIPPLLDGVGDKLNDNWLKHVLENGANDRPYMLTRMPRFGTANVGHLVKDFASLDRNKKPVALAVTDRIHRVRSAGRFLAGDKALACIKCHYFANHKATGIQSLDLLTMTRRLRKDWFIRYMLDPQAYRPGTRMPAGWPRGQTLLPDVLDGISKHQIASVWEYLADGGKAGLPRGLIRNPIELEPTDEPIIYRNFITGVSPRGIAVGYPEKANLAFDADQVALKLIWHNAFIDAAKHWNGRGQGFQPPLGDHLVTLSGGVPFATLATTTTAWPTGTARKLGYRFTGYRIDKQRRPVFRYRFGTIEVEDHPRPVKTDKDATLVRTLTLQRSAPGQAKDKAPAALWYRAAAAPTIELQKNGTFVIDKILNVSIQQVDGQEPVLRKHGNQTELLVPVHWDGDKAVIVHRYAW